MAPSRKKNTAAGALTRRDPPLFGANRDPGLVALEHVEKRGKPDSMMLLFRRAGKTVREHEAFRPFLVAERRVLKDCPVPCETEPLSGKGKLNGLVLFHTWKDCLAARSWLSKTTGRTSSAPDAPYLFLNDPVQQHLILTGRSLFLGMQFQDLKRMQLDIECITTAGFEFCNPEREGDRIVAIALADSSGWTKVLTGEERDILKALVEVAVERDPDVL